VRKVRPPISIRWQLWVIRVTAVGVMALTLLYTR
jgi:hypothetical protein